MPQCRALNRNPATENEEITARHTLQVSSWTGERVQASRRDKLLSKLEYALLPNTLSVGKMWPRAKAAHSPINLQPLQSVSHLVKGGSG